MHFAHRCLAVCKSHASLSLHFKQWTTHEAEAVQLGHAFGLFSLPGGHPRPRLPTTGSAGSGSGATTSEGADAAGGSAGVVGVGGTSSGCSAGRDADASGAILLSPMAAGFAGRSSQGRLENKVRGSSCSLSKTCRANLDAGNRPSNS